ncbi:MAG: MazG nucleotide pyrophosphohydrolase domain-containing protein [Solirubrobacterales bacterium]
MSDPQRSAEAVARLDAITRRLRVECPWDREQDERSIVPHTVEEAYELAEAAETGDDAKLLDELGDVLFQVHFLSLLMEERGAGDMAAVAHHCVEKLIRRHPHVFGPNDEGSDALPAGPVAGEETSSSQAAGEESTPAPPAEKAPEAGRLDADAVLGQWDRIKRDVEGQGRGHLFAEVPENLPALLYARKLQRRAANRSEDAGISPSALEAAGRARAALAELEALAAEGENAGPTTDPETRAAIERALGEALFATVDAARQLRCDPELALRAEASRYRKRLASAN